MKKWFIFLCFITLSLSAATKAVVFDWGGVLAFPDRKILKEFLRETCQVEGEEFEKLRDDRIAAHEKGISEIQFWKNYAKKKNILLPSDWEEKYHSAMKKSLSVSDEMYAFVDELKSKQIPVGLLSNVDNRVAGFIREYGFYEPFDPCLLSCEIGSDKPAKKAYKILLEKMRYAPHEIVFFDDRPENIEAAKKEGIDAIQFQSPSQVREELKKRALL